MSISETKRRVRQDARMKRAADRVREARERDCFWTWPWGHAYEYVDTLIGPKYIHIAERCAACGKERLT